MFSVKITSCLSRPHLRSVVRILCFIRRPRGERGLAPEQVVAVSRGPSLKLSNAAAFPRLEACGQSKQPSSVHPSPQPSPVQLSVRMGLAEAASPNLPAQFIPASPNQPSPVHPSPQPSPVHLSPASVRMGLDKALLKFFLLPDSDFGFGTVSFFFFLVVFGLFGAAMPLHFPVLQGWFWGWFRSVLGRSHGSVGLVRGLAQVLPKGVLDRLQMLRLPSFQAAVPLRFAVLSSPAQRSPAQPSQLSVARPSRSLGAALPKLCQSLFLTGFRCGVFGRRNAVRFWLVWGRRAFPCSEGVAVGPGFWRPAQFCRSCAKGFVCTGFRSSGLFRFSCGSFGAAMPSPARPNPAQPSQPSTQASSAQHPGNPSTARGHCQSRAKGFLTGKGFLPDSDASFSAAGMLRFGSVFGLFGAAVVRGWLWGLVFGAQPSPAKALPDRAVCSVFGAARLGSPTQPSPASPAQQECFVLGLFSAYRCVSLL